jgi:hypothetical protein
MQSQLPGAGSPAAQEFDHIQSIAMPDMAQKAKVLWSIWIILFGWVSLCLEMPLRREFGTRYLSILRLFFAYWTINFFLVVMGVLNGQWLYFIANPLGYIQLTLQQPFTLLFLFYCGFHRARIWERHRRGIRYHTMSFGISRIRDVAERFNIRNPLLNDDWLTFRFTEPAICVAVSLVIVRTNPVLGNFLLLASLSLFTKNLLIYSYQQNRIWDLSDAQIEAEFFNAAAQGAPKTETAGFSVVRGLTQTAVTQQPVHAASNAKHTTANISEVSQQGRGKSDFAATVGAALAGKPNIPDATTTNQNDHN